MQLPELKTDIKKEKVSLCNRATYEATANCILDYLITMETDSNLEVMYAFVISGAQVSKRWGSDDFTKGTEATILCQRVSK